MDKNKILILVAMAGYMLVMLLIGVSFAKKSNKSSADYFIGGRSLGPWVAAMSAEASDMSGWLLMGLPGVAYWCGLADAFWTAIGLGIGTYANWLLVSKRLRRYSLVAGNAITIPEFFSNRYKEQKTTKPILLISSLFILVFFAVYVGSCFVTGGKLFSTLFGFDYRIMMLVGAVIVLAYTLLGGFLAESTTDFIQGLIMIFALLAVLVFGVIHAGGVGQVAANIRDIPGFVQFFGMANPVTNADGVQQIQNNLGVVPDVPVFGSASSYGLLTVLSTMSWGLGYFGMPQVLLRFMAIRKTSELKRSRRIATIWCFIAMTAAVMIGLLGRAISSTSVDPALLTSSGAEKVFIQLSQLLFHPLFAGLVMAGILAAAMSSSDSYLLIASSAVSKNIFQGMLHKKATEKQVMWVSRIALLLISVFGVIIAWNENSNIFKIVSFAWAGFGATFGPLMLFSLFWKRTTKWGAIAGMVGGGGMVFFYKLFIRVQFADTMFNIYELLPAFLFSCLLIVVVSLLTKQPGAEIQAEFEKAKSASDEDIEAGVVQA